MRVLAIACVVLAGAGVAFAQAPVDPAPPPAPAGPAPGPLPIPPSLPVPDPPAAPAPAPPAPAAGTRPERAKLDRALAAAACAAREPDCDWIETLSGLEQQSVKRGLAARGFEVEPSPWGKVVRTVHIYNEDVFAEGHRLLRLLNFFHVTTKQSTIRKDLVIESGEVYSQERVEETARRLRDPLFSSVIAVVPVKSPVPGTVDLLVVTRDIWSLRLNTQYTFQQGSLTDLALSLSENNFLGRRNVLAAAFTMDQGAIQAGPLFIDKNVLGEHLELRARINAIVNREALFGDGELDREGSSSEIRLSKVLWRLSSQWGGGVTFSHRNAIEREFAGLDLRQVRCAVGDARCQLLRPSDIATVPEEERFPLIYGMRRWRVSANAVRQFGTTRKHQISFGHAIDSIRPQVLAPFGGLASQREAYRSTFLPPSEVNSAPYVAYSMFTPRFRTRRNVQTYALAEDLRLGPDFEVSYGVGLELLGSDANFQRGGVGGGWTIPWGQDGSARLAAGYSTRYQDGAFRDNAATVSTRIVSPTYLHARLVAESSFATRWNDRTAGFYYIGSSNGLRGFDINQFYGKRLWGSQIEVRTLPTALWVLRLGAVLFYDVGGAADTLDALALHHDVGIGIRSLLPQTSRELFRFDLAFPLDGPSAGRPRFIAGFQSEF